MRFQDAGDVRGDDGEIGERHRQGLIAPAAERVRSFAHGLPHEEADDDGDEADLITGGGGDGVIKGRTRGGRARAVERRASEAGRAFQAIQGILDALAALPAIDVALELEILVRRPMARRAKRSFAAVRKLGALKLEVAGIRHGRGRHSLPLV